MKNMRFPVWLFDSLPSPNSTPAHKRSEILFWLWNATYWRLIALSQRRVPQGGWTVLLMAIYLRPLACQLSGARHPFVGCLLHFKCEGRRSWTLQVNVWVLRNLDKLSLSSTQWTVSKVIYFLFVDPLFVLQSFWYRSFNWFWMWGLGALDGVVSFHKRVFCGRHHCSIGSSGTAGSKIRELLALPFNHDWKNRLGKLN